MDSKGRILLKRDLDGFLKKLTGHQIIAPVKKEIIRFERIKSSSEICFEGIARYPVKEYVYPGKKSLFKFKDNEISEETTEGQKIAFFGLRLCDLNAFFIADKFLLGRYPDEDYRKRREKILLIGLNCEKPVDRFCFCSSMELRHFYDLFFYDRGNYFHIKIGSEKGRELVKGLQEEEYLPKPLRCFVPLKTKDIGYYYDDPEWEKIADDCISCGMCTNLCPTCFCFDIKDKVNLDLRSGERRFEWDSCMYRDFTKVAGGEIFRKERLKRFKHRIYHKITYFKEDFGVYMCTGCGRCIRHCPTTIYWTGAINHIYAEKMALTQVKQKRL